MGTQEDNLESVLKQRTFEIFKGFLTRVTKLEELGSVGNQLLNGCQQGLELLRRPPIDMASETIGNIIKGNETKRIRSYIEVGCINNHDRVQSMIKSKTIVNELQCLLEDLTGAIQTANRGLLPGRNGNMGAQLDQQANIDQVDITLLDVGEPQMTDYAALMGIIYTMVKQDYVMQEMIITSLSLKSTSEELQSYSLMWSLRPFISDEIMHQAWRYIG